MKPPAATSATAIVGHAAECVRKAMENWNAADLGRVACSQELLERAVADLKQMPVVLGQNPPRNLRQLSALVAALRKDVDHMSRVVDACSGFQRGMAARLGDTAIAYDSTGRGLEV